MPFIRRETAILLIGDFISFAFSLWVALFFRNLATPEAGYFAANLGPFIPVFLLSLAVFYVAGLYEKQTRIVKRSMGERIATAQVANVLLAALFFFLLPLSIAPKTILAIYLAVSVAIITLWRVSLFPRLLPGVRISAVLVGRGQAVDELFEEVNGNDRYRISFASRIGTEGHAAGEISKLVVAATKHGARVIVLDTRDPSVGQDLSEIYNALLGRVSFIEFSEFYEEIFDRVPLGHIDHGWLLESLPRRHSLYDLAKRVLDVAGSVVGLVLAFPFVLFAALVLLVQGGQPFIFQERIGRGGRIIYLLKLRTMLFYDAGDPEKQKKNRVIPFGKFLRVSRVDELPQLWNVLLGELSFVGPRPEFPKIAAVYEKEIPYYHARHVVPPGLSGWAQIKDYDAPKGPADIERTRRKLSYDLYYVKHRSFALDIAIALKTIRALLAFSGT